MTQDQKFFFICALLLLLKSSPSNKQYNIDHFLFLRQLVRVGTFYILKSWKTFHFKGSSFFTFSLFYGIKHLFRSLLSFSNRLDVNITSVYSLSSYSLSSPLSLCLFSPSSLLFMQPYESSSETRHKQQLSIIETSFRQNYIFFR